MVELTLKARWEHSGLRVYSTKSHTRLLSKSRKRSWPYRWKRSIRRCPENSLRPKNHGNLSRMNTEVCTPSDMPSSRSSPLEIGSVKWSVYQTYLAASSYYIWGLLLFLVIARQLKGVSEKVWIKIWTGAYDAPVNASDGFVYRSFGTGANEILLTSDITHTTFQSDGWRINIIDLQLPSASTHPLFYIGVYAAIGMFGILLQLASVTLQYTGALRA
jgi:hypothetical protein